MVNTTIICCSNIGVSGTTPCHVMKIAKCTTWDGRDFYTDKIDAKSLGNFLFKVKKQYTQEQINQFEIDRAQASVEMIEMTREEYFAIPASNESAELFS